MNRQPIPPNHEEVFARKQASDESGPDDLLGALCRRRRTALGLEQAGFSHAVLVEIDAHCCSTLRANRPGWQVFEKDLRLFVEQDVEAFKGIELLAGGLPCPWTESAS